MFFAGFKIPVPGFCQRFAQHQRAVPLGASLRLWCISTYFHACRNPAQEFWPAVAEYAGEHLRQYSCCQTTIADIFLPRSASCAFCAGFEASRPYYYGAAK